jgi:hypothetical protein
MPETQEEVFIVFRARAHPRGRRRALEPGVVVCVPPKAVHELINDGDTVLKCVSAVAPPFIGEIPARHLIRNKCMAYRSESLTELEARAQELRLESVDMIHRRGAGHPGGALSAAEIMVALFFHHLRLDPARPDWPERDRFILSKGHATTALYYCLSRRGYFPQEDHKRWGGLLQGI